MGKRSRRSVIAARTPGELDAMAAAGSVVARALDAVSQAVTPGVSTKELDELAEETIRAAGAIPAFKGYEGFPASICTSVDDAIIHGIPDSGHIVREGSLLSVDCGAILDGWVGDSARTFPVGTIGPKAEKLNRACEWVLNEGIQAMVPGNRLTDVSHALQLATGAAQDKFGIKLYIVEGYGGHGIGRSMHEDPYLPNEGKAHRGPLIQEGSVLAIEPMLALGTADNFVDADDDWTVYTLDGSWAAHWEHTVAATCNGPRILTMSS